MDITNYKQLRPAILTNQDGIDVAPLTTANNVFSQTDEEEVKNVEEILEELKNSSNTVLYTKVQVIESTFDGQCIFNLKYPVENYDIEKFPIVVFARTQKGGIPEYIPSDFYRINNNYPNDDQLLFNTNKVEEFNKGESFAVIYHYSDVIYKGSSINADLINNIFLTLGKPEPGQELLNKSVYLDFDNSQIIYYDNGETKYFPIGSNKIIKHRITIEQSTQEIPVNFDDFNPLEDTLVVYENNTYVPEGEYYTIGEDLIMRRTHNIVWSATSYDPINFDFVIYKRSSGIQGINQNYQPGNGGVASVPNNSITENKLSLELQQTINEMKAEIEALKQAISNLSGH